MVEETARNFAALHIDRFLGGYVGLESGSPRVNKSIINKGVDPSDAEAVIKSLDDAGILVHVSSIVGMPGETEKEALMTYDFLKRWHRLLKLNWQVYPLYVLEQSPVAQRATELGLELTPLPDDFLVESMGYHPKAGLSQEASMSLAITFNEKLRRFMHPLARIMDIESLKVFLLVQMAKGVPPNKVRRPA